MAKGSERIPGEWMWAAAARLLDEADALQRRFFDPLVLPLRSPAWRAPVDVCEHEGELMVVVALPGVPADRLSIAVDETGLVVRGERSVPLAEGGILHRLEIPHGLFERRLSFPCRGYRLAHRHLRDGCLYLTFRRGVP